MEKYRIYALIHGQTLPMGLIFDCEIRFMDFDEQKRRGFAPVKYEFSENNQEYRTYVTSIPFIDPIKIHTDHVIVYEIEEYDPRGALGGAIRQFDKLCSRLFLAGIQDVRSKTERFYSGETYLYQVNKIYRIDSQGEEQEISLELKSGNIFLPNRPERSSWLVEETEKFLDEILEFKDPIFNKALKYLYSSSMGHFRLTSYEKIALDHFKSIEIIINAMSTKDNFKDRVDEAATLLNITQEESSEIKKYWDARSKKDLAHSNPNDFTAFYPNQFPLPESMEYPWAYFGTARAVLLKYFDFRKRYFFIDIQKTSEQADHLSLGVVNEHSECNHLFFQTKTKIKKDILFELKKSFAENFQIEQKDLEVGFSGSKEKATVFIKDPTKNVQTNSLHRKMIVINF